MRTAFRKHPIAREELEEESPPQTPRRLMIAQRLCRRLPPIISARVRSVIYPQRLAFRDDLPFTVKSLSGSHFSGRTSDFHGYPFSVHGYYEWRNWALASVVCEMGDTIIEIGANVGTETVGFRDIVGHSGKLFAFEPVPSNLEALRQLTVFNQWENVRILPYALGEEEAQLQFALPPNKHASGVGHLALGFRTKTDRTIEIECRRLDSFADEIGSARAVFCDAEGAETMILRGAENYLRHEKPILVLEASPKLLVRAGSSLQELHAILCSLNYVAFAVGRFGLTPVKQLNNSRASNWFCVHDSMTGLAQKCSSTITRCGLMPCVRGLNPLCR